MSWLIRNVEIPYAATTVDVRLLGGSIAEVGTALRPRGETEMDGRGAALVPGLHDHHLHLHLHGAAAARASVDCATGLDALARSGAARIRAVGFGDSVDRHVLDRIVPDRPVRVQHRSGALWMLNTPALAELEPLPHLPGVERDHTGAPTGRLWRLDELLRGTWPALGDLPALGRELTAYGITGVTDATPGLTETPAHLPQRVTLLGERKLLLHDHDLPSYDELLSRVRALRRRDLPVAVHCVTRTSLLLTLAVLAETGTLPGDRIEHGAVIPDPALLHGLIVVTQPAFPVVNRERYTAEVESDDRSADGTVRGAPRSASQRRNSLPFSNIEYTAASAASPDTVSRTAVWRSRRPSATLARGLRPTASRRRRTAASISAHRTACRFALSDSTRVNVAASANVARRAVTGPRTTPTVRRIDSASPAASRSTRHAGALSQASKGITSSGLSGAPSGRMLRSNSSGSPMLASMSIESSWHEPARIREPATDAARQR
ncbi:amidohydrolase family protein [Nocardia asiatica]|uniref:hypothetical protein n=1 Tax=Nocardia asiatica TaxID=209252 RepID=UPI00030828FC|nr:hypothetical protein [Nocardia asiatica]